MVSHMEEYTQKNGMKVLKVFTKPTGRSPGGYFYISVDVITNKWHKERWNAHQWSVYRDQVSATCMLFLTDSDQKSDLRLVHVNGVGIDNVWNNVLVLTRSQMVHGRPSKGYFLTPGGRFYARVVVDGKKYVGEERKTEFEVLRDVVQMRKLHCFRLLLDYTDHSDRFEHYLKFDYTFNYLSARSGSPKQGEYVGYDYFFYLDRRQDRDLLDLERTGVISTEEAMYHHVMRHVADNAWYYYRYNLGNYFRYNHIPIPDFSTDINGFMTDRVTGRRLCPF